MERGWEGGREREGEREKETERERERESQKRKIIKILKNRIMIQPATDTYARTHARTHARTQDVRTLARTPTIITPGNI